MKQLALAALAAIRATKASHFPQVIGPAYHFQLQKGIQNTVLSRFRDVEMPPDG
jgi:hypothetical protein